ncbi:MAG TPA: hypothetical protein PLG50_11595, partial [bacterium]|nr:hypothetical protein [bacterium]
MKNRRILAVLLWSTALIVACGDKNPAKPKPKDEDLIQSTVGPAGGKLETDQLKITIPAGAFSSPIELSLQVQTSP